MTYPTQTLPGTTVNPVTAAPVSTDDSGSAAAPSVQNPSAVYPGIYPPPARDSSKSDELTELLIGGAALGAAALILSEGGNSSHSQQQTLPPVILPENPSAEATSDTINATELPSAEADTLSSPDGEHVISAEDPASQQEEATMELPPADDFSAEPTDSPVMTTEPDAQETQEFAPTVSEDQAYSEASVL